jgi:hypothetical protein
MRQRVYITANLDVSSAPTIASYGILWYAVTIAFVLFLFLVSQPLVRNTAVRILEHGLAQWSYSGEAESENGRRSDMTLEARLWEDHQKDRCCHF